MKFVCLYERKKNEQNKKMRPHLVPMPISIKNAKDRNNIETSSEDKIEINENKYLCRNKQHSLKIQKQNLW